jgi:DNA modification methylase
MGSGTTAAAAVKEERSFLGYEINEAYYKTSIRRIAVESRQLELFGGAGRDTE